MQDHVVLCMEINALHWPPHVPQHEWCGWRFTSKAWAKYPIHRLVQYRIISHTVHVSQSITGYVLLKLLLHNLY